MFQRIIRALFPTPQPTQPKSDSEQELVLPHRGMTKMEQELGDLTKASIEIIRPTLADIQGISQLPQGSLTSIWTEAHLDKESSVEVIFVGRDAHSNGPYALLRAKNKDMYAFDQVRRSLEARLDVLRLEDILVSKDESSGIVRFPREMGLVGMFSDKQLFTRALRLVTEPSDFGAEAVELTRLILRPGDISWVARVNRLGDAPYTASLDSSEPRILITREDEALAS